MVESSGIVWIMFFTLYIALMDFRILENEMTRVVGPILMLDLYPYSPLYYKILYISASKI
jgi:hypothetical protein